MMEENKDYTPSNKDKTPSEVKKKAVMLTTIDNPFDPFEDFAQWFVFDSKMGYNTCGLLAIVARTSNSLLDEVNDFLIEDAIDSIIENDFLNIYKKIEREVVEEE